jgi:glyoxylase-like metal-dependent hydrolase (beta-lactamase superfamily II)
VTELAGPVEVAAGVHVFAHPAVTVNAVLVIGGARAAVVDTLATEDQARDLLAAVRDLTDLPLVLVNTHAHFDHVLGNHTLGAEEVWAHEAAARAMRDDEAGLRRAWAAECRADYPELVDPVAAAPLRAPNRTVHSVSTVDLGGRVLELRHHGPAHTDGDLVASVPDVDVLIAGDLVESAGPPAFAEAYPLEWPDTLAAILAGLTGRSVVVPGHGPAVDAAFVRAQHDQLTALAWLIRDGHADDAPPEAVAAKAPYAPAHALPAVRRGYAELSGRA